MPGKKTINNVLWSNNLHFFQSIYTDSFMVPCVLLRDYAQLRINESELVVLLRIFNCANKQENFLLEDVQKEFSCTLTEAKDLIMPFQEKGFIGLARINGRETYNMDGLYSQIFELWSYAKSNHLRNGNNLKGEKMKDLPDEQAKVLGRLYRSFEKELGRTLSPSENQKISQWLEADGMSPPMIEEALKRAVLQGKASLAYIDRILLNWQQKGFRSLDQVAKGDEQWVSNQTKRQGSKAKKAAQCQYSKIYDEIL